MSKRFENTRDNVTQSQFCEKGKHQASICYFATVIFVKKTAVTLCQAQLVLGWGDCLRVGTCIPSRYITSQLGQLSLASL